MNIPAAETTLTAPTNFRSYYASTTDYVPNYHREPANTLGCVGSMHVHSTVRRFILWLGLTILGDYSYEFSSLKERPRCRLHINRTNRNSARSWLYPPITTSQQSSWPTHFSEHQMHPGSSRGHDQRPATLALERTCPLPARQVGNVRTRHC